LKTKLHVRASHAKRHGEHGEAINQNRLGVTLVSNTKGRGSGQIKWVEKCWEISGFCDKSGGLTRFTASYLFTMYKPITRD